MPPLKETAKSIPQNQLPDGIYVGNVGGWVLTILSQDYYGKTLDLEWGIRAKSVAVVVIVKNKIAYCYSRMVPIIK